MLRTDTIQQHVLPLPACLQLVITIPTRGRADMKVRRQGILPRVILGTTNDGMAYCSQ